MSSEALRSLYAKKRVKHKVLMRSHLIQKDTPIP